MEGEPPRPQLWKGGTRGPCCRARPGRGAQLRGERAGVPPTPRPGLAQEGEQATPLPSVMTSGLQHLPHEAGANQSQMWEQQKLLIILTRKSPIYKEIMK